MVTPFRPVNCKRNGTGIVKGRSQVDALERRLPVKPRIDPEGRLLRFDLESDGYLAARTQSLTLIPPDDTPVPPSEAMSSILPPASKTFAMYLIPDLGPVRELISRSKTCCSPPPGTLCTTSPNSKHGLGEGFACRLQGLGAGGAGPRSHRVNMRSESIQPPVVMS